jgi:hypothetical protein
MAPCHILSPIRDRISDSTVQYLPRATIVSFSIASEARSSFVSNESREALSLVWTVNHLSLNLTCEP